MDTKRTGQKEKLWSKMALLMPHLILRVKPGHKDARSGLDSIRDEFRKRLALAEKGYLEQLLREPSTIQEKEKQREKKKEGPGTTDKEDDSFRRATEAADRGQLRTAARLLRGSKLLPPTESTADAIIAAIPNEQCSTEAHGCCIRRGSHSHPNTMSFSSTIRDAKWQAHPGPSGERNNHISALLVSPRGLPVLTQCVQLWADQEA